MTKARIRLDGGEHIGRALQHLRAVDAAITASVASAGDGNVALEVVAADDVCSEWIQRLRRDEELADGLLGTDTAPARCKRCGSEAKERMAAAWAAYK